ncbi:type IX secretion/gliding motility protein PorT/SprT [Ulvibacter litoralis]|uniref:Outer membrane protein beta-barrel domain-containing protein n=1 Tax=Ulvibacter litoralis TaxID=227084 RepID=A0A1G7GG42_9FLAO|nr:porin family protein [Ulvibacter litoralis]GHC56327.1 PorT protein [Ulvibacter litoralis]SDE87132.1 Outer membrane protein beta-barrel domain-containing protein [Ulvibacter litoralis]
MKKLFFIIAILFLTQTAQAQLFSKERLSNLETFDNRFLTWGYYLGFNNYDFNFDYIEERGNEATDITVEGQTGFNVGLIGDMRINKYINLRLEPGLSFTQRNLFFPGFEDERDILREVKSTYIHIPLLVKVSTKRLNNIKPFIIGGIGTSLNLSSNEKNPDDNKQGEFRTTSNTSYYELGVGIDFYLYYFKFSPSIRGVFATSDELIPDNDPNSPWTSNIDKMSTRGVFINFTFQ